MVQLPMTMPMICAVVFPEVGCGVGGCVVVSFPLAGAVAVTVVVTVVVIVDAGLQAVIRD